MSGLKACNRALWSPDVLTRSVLSAWWNADDHGTVRMTDDGAGLISSWIDRIGGMALTGTTTARPTWASGSFNSTKAGVTFDGSATTLAGTTLTTLPTGAVASEMWLSAVQTLAQTGVLVAYGAIGAGARRQISSNSTFHPLISDGSTNLTQTGTPTLASPGVVSGQMFSTTENGWMTGVAFPANPATIATLNTGTTRLRLGASNNTAAATFFGGVIRHAFILTGTLSLADRQRLEGYLAWDGGFQASLPQTHPYQLFRP
jgi:hypothetical protein